MFRVQPAKDSGRPCLEEAPQKSARSLPLDAVWPRLPGELSILVPFNPLSKLPYLPISQSPCWQGQKSN